MKTEYVEAPDEYDGNRSTHFLAGGISNCPDWQQEISTYLQKRNLDAVIVNPRRKNFPMGNKVEGIKQIEWEVKYLKKAHSISFWFPEETLCPIVLFELGSWSMTDKKIFVGCHNFYSRRFDVEVQTSLRKPDFDFAHNIEHLANQILAYYLNSKQRKNGKENESNLIEKHITEIDDAIAEYRTKWARKPKVIVLGIAHRQAIKLMYPNSYGGDLDPRAFGGIEIIKKEDTIIL